VTDPTDPHPATLLADHVLAARDAHPWFRATGGGRAPLPEPAVRRVIRLAYDASLMQEEGRFPTAHLVCGGPPPAVRFGDDPPRDAVPVRDPDTLRRLAPTVARPGSALALEAVGGELACVGVHVLTGGLDPAAGAELASTWETGEALPGAALSVRIEGPGRLRAGIPPAAVHRLRGGQVRPSAAWAGLPPVRAVFEAVGAGLLDRLRGIDHPLRDRLLDLPFRTTDLVGAVWSHALCAAAGGRRGGTFVVRLGGADPDARGGYPARLDVGSVFEGAVRRALQASGPGLEAFRQAWRSRRGRLFDAAEQMAGLSAADGCVVLGPDLGVVGFGAKLGARAGGDVPPELAGTGTRHQSAYHYCAARAALAFVVSQDGQLTVIASRHGGPPAVASDVDPEVPWPLPEDAAAGA
jgi:hypothetical protein